MEVTSVRGRKYNAAKVEQSVAAIWFRNRRKTGKLVTPDYRAIVRR